MDKSKRTLSDFFNEASNLIGRIRSKELLSLTVRTRDKVLFEGEAKSVTSTNEIGVFSVLPQHANFISVIKEFLTVTKSSGEKVTFQTKTGLLKIWENEAHVFLDVLEPVEI
ncbi:hypothetical protein COS55_02365 [Candidatus Shapirobacteria bacterium CG03_land_8_20_14_0_80_40_19]|uniref:ATP synthase F1 complex delta/epsilon subunit N-terminal domain-containing protein n=1 Tax=Candidatus Shapirobacteria bacterium CG03_land_8_20_14_0_80_40_19 TaxID=1974880 RepID=A0A2M7BDI8_9BACT|nr:MAG: hypothetical protein COS55_02365 [Candidatus Shapirobacteria bacterium CG03_land_8_20_14_0_80_40_19]